MSGKSKLYFREHNHVGPADGEAVTSTTGNFAIGTAAADGVDYSLTFTGYTSTGVLTWMEDEDYLKFSDDVLIDSTERVYFRDTGIYLYSANDGYLDIVADTGVRFSTTITVTGSAALSSLTDTYIPYHVSDAAGLANSPLQVSSAKVGVGMVPTYTLDVTGSIRSTGAQLDLAHYSYGVISDGTFSGTAQANCIYTGGIVAAGVTVTDACGLRIDGMAKGSGAGITNYYGLYIYAAGSIGATSTYSIYVAAGDAYFAANVSIATDLFLLAGSDIVLAATSGTRIGTGTNQLLGFYNASPVDQPAAVADATGAGDVVAQLNALLARIRELGLIAT